MNTHLLIQESFGHLLSKQKGSSATEKVNSSNNYLQLVRSGILRYLQQKSMDYLANPASVCHNGTITVVASQIWDFLIESHPCILESQYRACILKKEVSEAIVELSHCLPVPNFSLQYDIKRGRKNEQQMQSALVKRKKESMINHEQCSNLLSDVVSSPVIQQEKKKHKSESNCCNNSNTANLLVSNVFWNDVANHLSVQKKEKSKQQRQAAALQQRKLRATTSTPYISNSNSFYCMPMEECNELKNLLQNFISGSQPSLEQSNPSANADYYFNEDPAEFATMQNTTNASTVLMGNQEQEQLMDTSMEFGTYTDLMGNMEQVCEVDSEIDPSCKFDNLFEQTIQSTLEEEQFQIRIISQCISPIEQSSSSSISSRTTTVHFPSAMDSLWTQSASEDSSPYCNHMLQLTP